MAERWRQSDSSFQSFGLEDCVDGDAIFMYIFNKYLLSFRYGPDTVLVYVSEQDLCLGEKLRF